MKIQATDLEKKLSIHLSNLYPECVKNSCKLITKKQLNKNWAKDLDMSKKKIHEWPKQAWTDAQHYSLPHKCKLNHNERPLHIH